MPLVHCKLRPFKYPIPGKFDPSTNTHGPAIWATGYRCPSKSTLPPTVAVAPAVLTSLDGEQRRALRAIEKDALPGETIVVTHVESDPADTGFEKKEKKHMKNHDHFDRYDDCDDRRYSRRRRHDDDEFRKKCLYDTHRLVDRMFRKFLRSRGSDPLNEAQCKPRCNDLLISPETLCTLTGGNRSVWFTATAPAGGVAAGAAFPDVTIAGLGVSVTYCIADLLVTGTVGTDPLTADDLLIEIYVNGQLRNDFSGGLIRSASACNTLCGWCVCVGALEVITVRVVNTTTGVIAAGATVRLQTKRWFPGEDGYVCPSCGCATTKGSCGCSKKKRPPLSHHPQQGANIGFEVKDSSDIDIDITVSDDDVMEGD